MQLLNVNSSWNRLITVNSYWGIIQLFKKKSVSLSKTTTAKKEKKKKKKETLPWTIWIQLVHFRKWNTSSASSELHGKKPKSHKGTDSRWRLLLKVYKKIGQELLLPDKNKNKYKTNKNKRKQQQHPLAKPKTTKQKQEQQNKKQQTNKKHQQQK